jgi:hypothetical protein
MPQSNSVSMKIYDVTGRLIDVPFTENLKQGVHKKTINTSHLTPGTYFMVLSTESGQQVEKIVVAK